MEKRVRLQDVAAKLGVHFSTVSRALQNDPCLPAATVRKVKAMAEKLGYLPDPNARAMAVYRHAIKPAKLQDTITLLTASSIPERDLGYHLRILRPQAEKLGYRIEPVSTHQSGEKGGRLTHRLKTRGSAGLLVLPPPANSRTLRRLQLDWAQFPAVILGSSVFWPPLHRVSDSAFRNAKLLVRKLASLGYRRIGMSLDTSLASLHADGGWRGGYLAEMERFKKIPPPLYRRPGEFDPDKIRNWIHRERLDAVIVDDYVKIIQFRKESGFAVPEELGVAALIVPAKFQQNSGINPEFEQVWATALDFLVYLIRTNQRGIPKFPQRTLIEGTWVPGTTVRRINRGRSAAAGFD